MKEKFLWKLTTIGVNYEDDSLVGAFTEEEATEKWESLYGESDYLGGTVTKIETVDGHKVILQQI
jgi:hypothetical protein